MESHRFRAVFRSDGPTRVIEDNFVSLSEEGGDREKGALHICNLKLDGALVTLLSPERHKLLSKIRDFIPVCRSIADPKFLGGPFLGGIVLESGNGEDMCSGPGVNQCLNLPVLDFL